MKRSSPVVVGAILGISGVVVGGVLAFAAMASSVPPGETLGLFGAAMGIVVGVSGAAIGITARAMSRHTESAT